MFSKSLVIVVILILLLAACGGEEVHIVPPQSSVVPPQGNAAPSTPTGEQPAQQSPVTPTGSPTALRILAPTHFSVVLNRAAEQKRLNSNFTLQLTTYNPETHTDYWVNNLQALLAAGEGFDIFFADPRMPLYEFAQQGLLANITTLINDCPVYNLNDLYMQPLQALTINNNLYFFPLNFGFQFVSINDFMPDVFINQFAQMDRITVNQMMEMYFAMRAFDDMEQYFQQLRFASCRDMTIPGFMASNAISGFINFDSGVSNLDSAEFVRFLTNMQELFPNFSVMPDIEISQNFRYNSVRTGDFDPLRFYDARYLSTPLTQSVKSFMYVFSVQNEFRSPVSALIPFDASADDDENMLRVNFNNYIPLADEQGRLITNMGLTYPWNIISIVEGQNATLAWDFVSQYLIPASLNRDITNAPVPITSLWWARPSLGYYTFDVPIIRSFTREHLADTIDTVSRTNWDEYIFYIDDDGYMRY